VSAPILPPPGNSAVTKQQIFKFDLIALIALTITVLFTAYLATTPDVVISVKCLFLLILAISGLVLHHLFTGGIKFELLPTLKERTNFLLSVSFGFGGIVILQFLTFQLLPQTIIDFQTRKMFYLSAAISEELFFRYYLATLLLQKTQSPLTSTFATSLVFMVYHNVVYGFSAVALIIVFLSSMVLTFIYFISRRISVPIIIHSLVNLLAS
jgi:membrane protease YdiL (CAAX protease family)